MAKEVEIGLQKLSGLNITGKDLWTKAAPNLIKKLKIKPEGLLKEESFNLSEQLFTLMSASTDGWLNPGMLVFMLEEEVKGGSGAGQTAIASLEAARLGKPVAGCQLFKKYDAEVIAVTPNSVTSLFNDTFNEKISSSPEQIYQAASLINDIWQNGPADLQLASAEDEFIGCNWHPAENIRLYLYWYSNLEVEPILSVPSKFKNPGTKLPWWISRLPLAGDVSQKNPDWITGDFPSFPVDALEYQVRFPLGDHQLVFHHSVANLLKSIFSLEELQEFPRSIAVE